MSEYTKGPWRVGKTGPNGCHTIGTPEGLMVAMISHSVNYADQVTTAEANARLIAAAPELLEALEMVQSSYCLQINSQQETLEMKKARTMVGQAILKAKGE